MGLKNKRQPFLSMAQRLPNDPEFQQQIQALGGVDKALSAGFIKFMVANRTLNEKWRLQQATFRAAI